jgi:hypothetical protein
MQCISYTPTCILFLLSLCEPLLVHLYLTVYNTVGWEQIGSLDCSFCWYWWNWRPLLFKLSYNNLLLLTSCRSITMYDKLLACTYFQKGLYFTYNFFDFELLHTSLFVPDIQQCYTDLQQHRFQIQFPGKSQNLFFFCFIGIW